ncbi:platelet glycoprotein Ib alpha chain [Hoplias malabaricus]|uniref:platelet glycoprotein Ib alpha chain n=1 Tax=Hoplias malabaricus TaxID=27720 RepID=UPI00346256E8
MLLPLLLMHLLLPSYLAMPSGCHSDRNTDHRPRVSCVGEGLSAVPDGIDLGTQVLDLSQNQFSSLSWTMYERYTHLHELDLSGNHITIIQPSGPVLGNLKILRLSRNRLVGLGGQVFRSAPALMEIYLDRNHLRTLHDATFSMLPHLEVLDLSRNQIPALPRRLLETISSNALKTFDLEHNRVQHMPDDFFSSKPGLPYVYLSQNPWLCNCPVSYLQSYLEDQGENVYKHVYPSEVQPMPGDSIMKDSIMNDPESVLCSGPPELAGKPIIDLTPDEYCSSSTRSSYTISHFFPKETTPTPHIILPTVTSADLQSPTQTPSVITSTSSPDITTESSVASDTPAIPTNTMTTAHAPSSSSTASVWTTLESWTVKHFWTEVWTAWINESRTFIPTISETTAPTRWTYPTKLSASTIHPRTSKIPSTWAPTRILTAKPKSTSTTLSSVTSTAPTTALPGSQQEIGASGCMAPWCWWLFAGFFTLCLLSALCSCMIFLWILMTYINLYRPIQRRVQEEDRAVTLLTFQNKLNISGGGGVGGELGSVAFLPPEKIPLENLPVFRSVLFIAKGDEDREEEEGMREGARDEDKMNNAVTKIELEPAAAAAQEEKIGVTMRKERVGATDQRDVFRKTLYRVISREEETEGWREVEESWGLAEGGMTDRRKTRYSLILREELSSVDRDRGMEWLVGEWEMGGGGLLKEGSWGSLIRKIEGGASLTPPTPEEGGERGGATSGERRASVKEGAHGAVGKGDGHTGLHHW